MTVTTTAEVQVDTKDLRNALRASPRTPNRTRPATTRTSTASASSSTSTKSTCTPRTDSRPPTP
jgi:hypothetical protein